MMNHHWASLIYRDSPASRVALGTLSLRCHTCHWLPLPSAELTRQWKVTIFYGKPWKTSYNDGFSIASWIHQCIPFLGAYLTSHPSRGAAHDAFGPASPNDGLLVPKGNDFRFRGLSHHLSAIHKSSFLILVAINYPVTGVLGWQKLKDLCEAQLDRVC